MSTPSTCRHDMFKKRDFFDTSRGHVHGIDMTPTVERREVKIAAGLILISGVT
jgi:hypothetical protein